MSPGLFRFDSAPGGLNWDGSDFSVHACCALVRRLAILQSVRHGAAGVTSTRRDP